MSRVGKSPIPIPSGVTVNLEGKKFSAKGPLGEDSLELLDGVHVAVENDIVMINVDNGETDKKQTAYWGLFRALINNIIVGVSTGFEKQLEIVGVGYRATQQNKDVQFQLGFSHNILFSPPEGVSIEVMEPTKLKVTGHNKQKVGQVAANIRKLRPPEPYKGKGIRYKDEYVRKKAGKAGK